MGFNKNYSPKEFESEIFRKWEQCPSSSSQPTPSGKVFYLPLPPLDIVADPFGSALGIAVQDAMVRYHRMRGDETLWVPFSAGESFPTGLSQRTSGLSDGDLSALSQYLGALFDKDRLIDLSGDGFTSIVKFVFCDLQRKGIIYRAENIVHSSPLLNTVINESEIEYRIEDAKLYYITYFVSGSDNELIIATTSPETLLADQAVAVHPKDKRYKKLIGRKVILPILNKEIPIIADDSVDKDSGTGVITLTPGHNPSCFSVAKKHGLRLDYRVVDSGGFMTKEAGIFIGQDFQTARGNVVELLRSKGNLVKIEPYKRRVGYCRRTGCRVEPIISTQWFLRSGDLLRRVMQGYSHKEFIFLSEKHAKRFDDLLFSMKDCCISRQDKSGLDIPAYYDSQTGDFLEVTQNQEGIVGKYGKGRAIQEDLTLDSWFSFAILPFAMLGWRPKEPSGDFLRFYPSQCQIVGESEFPSWVPLSLLLSYEYTGFPSFKSILIYPSMKSRSSTNHQHAASDRKDLSRIISEQGGDIARISLLASQMKDDPRAGLSELIESSLQSLSKLWNIMRFVSVKLGTISKSYDDLRKSVEKSFRGDISDQERWFLQKLSTLAGSLTDRLERGDFRSPLDELERFTKEDFGDYFIENYKLLESPGGKSDDILAFGTLTLLRLWHPLAPFITEELSRKLSESSLLGAKWPSIKLEVDPMLDSRQSIIIEIIRSIRSLKSENGIRNTDEIDLFLRCDDNSFALIEPSLGIIRGLLKLRSVSRIQSLMQLGQSEIISGKVKAVELHLGMVNHRDIEGEKAQLKHQIDEKRESIRLIDLKLLSTEFIRSAPEHVVRNEQEKKMSIQEQLIKLLEKYSKYNQK